MHSRKIWKIQKAKQNKNTQSSIVETEPTLTYWLILANSHMKIPSFLVLMSRML